LLKLQSLSCTDNPFYLSSLENSHCEAKKRYFYPKLETSIAEAIF